MIVYASVRAFVSGFLLSLSLCLDIGLVNVAILRVAAQRGVMPAFAVGLGSCVGDLLYALLSVAGITALLRWHAVRWTIWIVGTGALSYLAVKMLRDVFRPVKIDLSDSGRATTSLATLGRDFGWGSSLALTSPSAILWFAALGGSIVASYGGDTAVLLPFLSGFFVAGVVWVSTLSYGAGRLRRVMGPRLIQTTSLVSGLLFVYFAVKVFMEGVHTFL